MIALHFTFKRVVACCLFICATLMMSAQSDTRMEFFPATDHHYAGLSVFSTTTGNFEQFYVENGAWVKNNFIPQPTLSIKGGDYRMSFTPGTNLLSDGLFVYSRNSGEFEILYLENGAWQTNPLLPGGKIAFGSKAMVLEFHSAKDGEVAYMTAYSVDGEKFGIYYVNGEEWVKSDLYP